MTQYYLVLINKEELNFGINFELHTPINGSFTQIASSFSADETEIEPTANYFREIINRESKELNESLSSFCKQFCKKSKKLKIEIENLSKK